MLKLRRGDRFVLRVSAPLMIITSLPQLTQYLMPAITGCFVQAPCAMAKLLGLWLHLAATQDAGPEDWVTC